MAAALIKLLMLSCRVIKVEGQERMQQALERSGGKVKEKGEPEVDGLVKSPSTAPARRE